MSKKGRNDDETKMIRIAVDDAIDDIIESGINERETDIEAIKEKIFLEVASRLEEAKLSSQVRFKDTKGHPRVAHPRPNPPLPSQNPCPPTSIMRID